MNIIYLGYLFTSNGEISSAVRKHACDKQKHFTKFLLFSNKNIDFPIDVKQVMDAVLFAALLCGCENWLGQSHYE